MSSRAHSGFVVIQTAILVLAVVGGTSTIAGPASAAAQNLTVTNEGGELQPNANLTFEVTDGVNVDDESVHVWIDSGTPNGEFDPGERNVTFDSANGETRNGTFPNVDLTPGTYALMAVENESLNGGERNETRATFTIDDTPPAFDGAVAFTETSGTNPYGDVGDTVVEVVFNESLSDGSGGTRPTPGDVLVKLTNGTVLNATFNDGGTGDALGDRRVVLDLGSKIGPADVKAVGVNESATFTDQAGNRVVPHIEGVRTATTTVAEAGANTTAFRGEEVAIVGDQDDEQVFMRNTADQNIIDNSTGIASKVFVWKSETWSTDPDYRVFFDGRTNPNFLLREDVSLALDELGVSVIPNRSAYSTGEAVTATVSANVGNRTMTARLNSNGSVEATRVLTLDGKRTAVSFGTRATGDYTIEVEDNTTGLTDSTGTFQVQMQTTPTATPTGTPTRTQTPTPSVTSTGTTTVSPTTATATATPPESTFHAITPRSNPTSVPTPTPTTASTPTPTETNVTKTPVAPDGVVDILGVMWEGATNAVGAMVDAISDALSGLLP